MQLQMMKLEGNRQNHTRLGNWLSMADSPCTSRKLARRWKQSTRDSLSSSIEKQKEMRLDRAIRFARVFALSHW